jgi:hypothetical protein
MLSHFGPKLEKCNTTKAAVEQLKQVFMLKKNEQQAKERQSVALKREAMNLEQLLVPSL